MVFHQMLIWLNVAQTICSCFFSFQTNSYVLLYLKLFLNLSDLHTLTDDMCGLQHRRLEQVEELFRKVDDRRKVFDIFVYFVDRIFKYKISSCSIVFIKFHS